MKHLKHTAFICIVILAPMGSPAQGVELTNKVWTLLGQDVVGWNNSELVFTSQATDGALTGYFDWVSTSRNNYGREVFDGMLNSDLTFTLHGLRLDPHPDFGGVRAISLSDYTGRVTPDGRQILDGTWLTRGGTRGQWESVAVVPEPGSIGLAMIGIGVLAIGRRCLPVPR